jgi:hypothetical protein
MPNQFTYSKQLLAQMSIKELSSLACCLLPIANLGDHRFLIGAESKKIIIKSDQVLLRTGGGFCTIEEHIKKYALSECLVIWRMMQ